MKFNKKEISGTLAIFLIIAFIYAVCNFIWWIINTPIIPTWDSAVHFNNILEKGYIFYNAPLITWIMKGMFYIFGKEYYDLIVIFVNYVFFLIPLYFIYKIGTELKDKETGNIAMILFALVPAVYGMSRQYGHQDYHIIAGITFNIYCLIKTDYFRNRKWTIWYGISVGLGLMIKDAFLAYFFVPFMYIVIMGLKEKADREKVINIFISIILGSLIAGWHYFRPFIIHKILHDPIIETVPVFAFDSLRITTIGLWEDLLSPPIFIIFVIGLIYFIWKYKGKYKNIILLWFFVPWLIIMLMPHHKLPEYGAGFIPAMILIGAVFISCIDKSYIKKTLILFLIVIGLLQYVDFSYKNLNIALFNLNFNKKYDVAYYKKNNRLIEYNKKQIENSFNLVMYLNKKYSKNIFHVLRSHNFIDYQDVLSVWWLCFLILRSHNFITDYDDLPFQMQLNNMRFQMGYYDNKKILAADIIIIFGIPDTPEEFLNYKINDLNPIEKEQFGREAQALLVKKIRYMCDKINEQYHKIDEFYLDSAKSEDMKVTLLGKKEKFPQFVKE